MFKSVTKLINGFLSLSEDWRAREQGLNPPPPAAAVSSCLGSSLGVPQEIDVKTIFVGGRVLTDGVDGSHDGDDGAVVVAVVEDVEHSGSLSPHS